MKAGNSLNLLLIILVFIGASLACSSKEVRESCKFNPILPSLLGASNSDSFNEILKIHGSVKEEQIPCIVDASTSWSRQKQINAATLISIAGGDRAVISAAERKMITETKVVEVWADIMESQLLQKKPELKEFAGLRPDMVAEALVYTNADKARLESRIQSTAIKAGVIADVPGIKDEIRKRLESNNADILQATLDSMPADMAREELPRLTQMLADFQGGKEYEGVESFVFRALLTALIRTEDEATYPLVKNAIEIGEANAKYRRLKRDDPMNFRNQVTFLPEDFVEKFCLYLIRENGPSKEFAFDVLETRITRKIHEPTVPLVKACLDVIENGDPSTDSRARMLRGFDNPSQIECEKLFQFLETGNIEFSGRKFGRDALPIGRKWLKEHE
ncbi:MAG: hypothetical protein WBO10_07705 [Pyrinomonadaceae bacterium]